ncbi:VNG_1110C family protein [Halocatena pleomorpha]|uniref:Uncharacterized protein n=1 Tax=Halocatena pleomorpha TaxID=1785090 RepID=A0A3P3RCP2_9EURY|nr:hypothetical protein [Halocatena pleomorpha]RRJ30233.1 hypothetical protein EIK79_09925 [Halocatena pleomorpha]
MIDIDSFRDSTQIILPTETLAGLRSELNRRFVLSFVEEETKTRIIGSPVEIREASNWLTRQGVAVA